MDDEPVHTWASERRKGDHERCVISFCFERCPVNRRGGGEGRGAERRRETVSFLFSWWPLTAQGTTYYYYYYYYYVPKHCI